MSKMITITTQLLDASILGRMSVKISNSTCRLGVIPRNLVEDTIANPKLREMMFDKYSFYMLLTTESSNKYSVYIGKTRNFTERVMQHLRKRINWQTAFVFNSSDPSSLTDTEINYLEYLGIKLANELNPDFVENAVIPTLPSISYEKECEMDDFFDDIKLLTNFCGCHIFESKIQEGSSKHVVKNHVVVVQHAISKEEKAQYKVVSLDNENLKKFHIFNGTSPKGVNATLYYNDEESRFIIAAGSIVKGIDGQILPKLVNLRQDVFLNDDISEQNGNFYILKKDIELIKCSRSDAGIFCTGTSTNGNIYWVDNNGKTIKDVFPQTK